MLKYTRRPHAPALGLGSVVAVVLSWHRNRSILLAVIHGILSWIYVLYFAMSRRENER